MEIGALTPADRHVEGVVEMMLYATQRYTDPLTEERLFAWHAALFPTGHSGMSRITVGAWRTDQSGPMLVVYGKVRYPVLVFRHFVWRRASCRVGAPDLRRHAVEALRALLRPCEHLVCNRAANPAVTVDAGGVFERVAWKRVPEECLRIRRDLRCPQSCVFRPASYIADACS